MMFKACLNCILFLVILSPIPKIEASPSPNVAQSGNEISTEQSLQNKYPDNDCGGVLEADAGIKTLSYRMQRPKDLQESCVWTIHASNGGSIKINVTSPLYYSNDDILAIGYFSDSNYDDVNSLTWQKISQSFAPEVVEVPGPVAFVQYLSEYVNPIFGFRLTYKAGDAKTSDNNFSNFFLKGEHGIFNYPVEGQEPKNNERVTVVVKACPPVSTANQQFPSWIHVINKNTAGTGNCADQSVNLYGFGDVENKWFKNDTVCPNQWDNWALQYTGRDDPVIFTFKSGANGSVGGFEIRWMNYNY